MRSYKALVRGNRHVALHAYVDDSPITAVGSRRQVINRLFNVSVGFSKITTAQKLLLSGKAQAVATDFKLACALTKALKAKGVHVKAAVVARDLSIPYSAGKAIFRDKYINKRVRNTTTRMTKVSQLSRIHSV